MISHYNHTVYEEALRKLQTEGLDDRIFEALKRESGSDEEGALCMHLGMHNEDEDYIEILDILNERGFLKEDYDFKESFYKQRFSPNENIDQVKQTMRNHMDLPWRIKKDRETILENVCLGDDFQLFSGYYASYVLGPEEFWDPERFGFSSTSDLWGVIGARMKQSYRNYLDKGYKWKSEVDGKQFITEVTGSEHGDFRLFRTDVTPYETIDPLGKRVSYRPELDSDVGIVAWYHSVEPSLLASVIKWIEQEEIGSEILKDPPGFLNQFEGQSKYLGNFADAGCEIHGPEIVFASYNLNIPKLNNIGKKEGHNHIFYPTTSNNYWGSNYIGDNGELIFCSKSKDKNEIKTTEILRIYPSEADNLIRGLFEQARNGLGRTSFNQVKNVLNYRFSEEFNADMERLKKYIN